MAIKKKEVDLGEKGSFQERPGALHRSLGIPIGEKIGPARIEAATHSSNPETRKEAISAKGFEHMHHSGAKSDPPAKKKMRSPFGKPKGSPAPSAPSMSSGPSGQGVALPSNRKYRVFGKRG